MFESILKGVIKVFGSQNERTIKRLRQQVERINALEPQWEKLTDAELRQKTDEFKQRLADGQTTDDILVDAFATVREMSKRTPLPGETTGLRHYDVQLIGGMVLHDGGIAEMATGEGKTLVGTSPTYLNALTGKGVHVITVNDYLAVRDRDWMAPIFERLGLTVGAIRADMSKQARRDAYADDITYGTNNEFGFDYLRDNMVSVLEEKVQRPHHFALLDEVDNILIDEARTPLIITGPSEGDTSKYYQADQVARKLNKSVDYEVKEKESQCILSEEGIVRAQELVGVDSFYTGGNMDWPHLLEQALRGHNLFEKDVDYVVDRGEQGMEIVIIDEFTGRMMPGRRWSDGLHQAVEAKERIQIRAESQTMATITFQNFFKLYDKLAGMTGTAMTEAGEFLKIYGLGVVAIPTNRPNVRNDMDDLIYAGEKDKFAAIAEEIVELHGEGRPILVGTTSIEKSEKLAKLLQRRGIKHEILNAKNHAREADIIAQAGRKGAVTVATNMAGRGTDIKLGGNVEALVEAKLRLDPDADPSVVRAEIEPSLKAEAEEVRALGGLHVLGTERHEARRIDNQLRGRCGRQGDPGSSHFFLGLDDDLMRRFASPRVAAMLQKLGLRDGQAIEHPWINKSIANAQKKVEGRNFEIRKNLLEYDNVMNEQRTMIYDKRDQILEVRDLDGLVATMCDEVVDIAVAGMADESLQHSEWDWDDLEAWYGRKTDKVIKLNRNERDVAAVGTALKEAFRELQTERRAELGDEEMDFIAGFVLRNAFDTKWKEHLANLDALKTGIGLRGYAQVDPKLEYKREAYATFEEMIRNIQDEVTDLVFRLELRRDDETVSQSVWADQQASHSSLDAYGTSQAQNQEATNRNMSREPVKPFQREIPKVGRNDPCPCGSGRKFKKCCGVVV